MKDRRFGLSYANVVATLALFVALGGTAVATGVIDGKKIKLGSVTGKQIRAKSVPGSDLRPNSVRGAQVRESTLAPVPRAIRANQADSAAAAVVAIELTPQGRAQLTDSCPPQTIAYAGSCFDAAARGSGTWPEAARICGEAGGRLPELDELDGFRRQPGITLDSHEHTAAYLDVNGIASGGEMTVSLSDSGNKSPGTVFGQSNARYRCVFPATNR